MKRSTSHYRTSQACPTGAEVPEADRPATLPPDAGRRTEGRLQVLKVIHERPASRVLPEAAYKNCSNGVLQNIAHQFVEILLAAKAFPAPHAASTVEWTSS